MTLNLLRGAYLINRDNPAPPELHRPSRRILVCLHLINGLLAPVSSCLPRRRHAAALPYFSVLSDDAGAWPAILSSIGLQPQPAGLARIFVARAGAAASTEWTARVENGAILILEGESSLADMFGFRRGPENVKVTSLTDVHRPALPIVWEKGLELPRFDLPAGAQVFARERWTGAPMTAGLPPRRRRRAMDRRPARRARLRALSVPA